MLKPITNKGLFWELRNSIWTLWTFFPFGFFNYISFYYIAMRLKDKMLFLYGVLYSIPFINVMAMDSINNPSSMYEDFSYITILVVWIISIVHVIKVRRHYLLTRANSVSYADQLEEENRQLQQRLQSLATADHQPKEPTPMIHTESKAVELSTTVAKNEAVAPIDVNTATEAELANIVEIGPLLASKIILERQQAVRFTSYDHFAQVMDFKPHIAHKLKKHLMVSNDQPQPTTSSKQGRVIDY
ncbi:MAG: helix-hairpin-helix domain-containing protein [Lysinibacillus sp.]